MYPDQKVINERFKLKNNLQKLYNCMERHHCCARSSCSEYQYIAFTEKKDNTGVARGAQES